MIRADLEAKIKTAAEAAIAAGELPQILLPEIVIERPARPEHGDYATNLPLRLARAARAKRLCRAKALAARLPVNGAVATAEAAPPGFINFRLSEAWLARQAAPPPEGGGGLR